MIGTAKYTSKGSGGYIEFIFALVADAFRNYKTTAKYGKVCDACKKSFAPHLLIQNEILN